MSALLEDRGDGVEMVLTKRLTIEDSRALEEGRVDRLVLNYALGYSEESLDFLQDARVRDLIVLDPKLRDLKPVYAMAQTLRSLRVTTNPSLTLDLAKLPLLSDIGAAWSQVSDSIGSAPGLLTAHLRAYDASDLVPLTPLPRIRSLVMKDQPRLRSLKGLSDLATLRGLRVYVGSQLGDLSDLRGSVGLEELQLESCPRVSSIDDLSECVNLRMLNLSEDGPIASLSPLRQLTRLERLQLFGTTMILDGDLSPIVALPRLRELRMKSRKAYSPPVSRIQAQLS